MRETRHAWKQIWAMFRAARRGTQVGIVCVAVLVACLLASASIVGMVGVIPLGRGLSHTSSTTATVAPLPTSTPITPTPTQLDSPVTSPLPGIAPSSPILGGSEQAFFNLYGQNNCCYENGWFNEGQFGPLWTGIWGADGPMATPTPIGDIRVTGVDLKTDLSDPWTVAQAQSMQRQFMPSDAVLVRSTVVYEIANPTPLGVETTYFSTLLARTLPLPDFQSVNDELDQQGTFYVSVRYTFDTPNSSPNAPLVDQVTLATNEFMALAPL